MKDVVVITGGGSGMGLETAKYMSKEKIIVICGRTEAKLVKGVEELKALGFEAYGKSVDTSDRASVIELVKYAQSLGNIKNVINAAGVSPAMTSDAEKLFRINALGTVYINQEFSKIMNPGSVIIDIASNSAYMTPDFMLPKKLYPLADTDEETFVAKMMKKCKIVKEGYFRAGMAYAFSKNFVCWYAQYCAYKYGKLGIRVASLSPGLIATDMGNKEVEHGGDIIPFTAEERMGKPEELGYAIATLADERNGYLAGVDILCDGGGIYGKKTFKKKK
ncbi:MAG: SDR family NAD(P)-dependent oxidoreductase [Clostridia bacterium]|nr:SDR family NAD(P)-dependent oxidoreductase [Clostridia bacterium]